MVLELEVERFECPYCGIKHEFFSDAMDCAQECTDIERPRQVMDVAYECEICKHEHSRKKDADDCEKAHIKKCDKKYLEFVSKKQAEEFLMMADKPGQKSLGDF